MPSPTLSAFQGLAGFTTKVVVGVGELGVSNNPAARITTYSLGSCLGVTMYDPAARAGGLLHIMLPDSSINPEKARLQPGMFADTGAPALLRAVSHLRAERHRLQVCVAGGAQIMDQGAVFNIGQRNYHALTTLLAGSGFRIHAEHVGGLFSRTMTLNLATGEVRLKIGGVPNEVVLWKG